MGVHISFVRSTQLDDFTVDQMRVMKVGGNHAAKEYFNSHGAGNIKDAKSKYTSRAATMYKEKLLRAVEADKREFPMGIVIPGMVDNEDAGSVDSKDDFFSDWEMKSQNRSLSSSPLPPKEVQSAVIPATSVVNGKKDEIETIGQNTARKASLKSLDDPPIIHHKPITSNILKPNKRSLGAKKATKMINFDEAERLAKEEELKRIQLEEKAKKEAEEAKAAVLKGQTEIHQQHSRNTSNTSNQKSQEPSMPRLGFGFDASEPRPKAQAIKPASASSFGFGGSGFGSVGNANNSNDDSASKRFGKAKGISSDQYFGRGAYDEAEK